MQDFTRGTKRNLGENKMLLTMTFKVPRDDINRLQAGTCALAGPKCIPV